MLISDLLKRCPSGFTILWSALLWNARLVFSGLSDVELLDTKLSEHFDVRVRPRVLPGSPVNITASVSLVHINSFDLEKAELEVTVLVKLEWNDPRLRWDVEQTENQVRQLVLPESNVWTPDVTITNAIGAITRVQDEQVIVESIGRLSRIQTYRTTMGCKTNMTAEEQSCVIMIGSWSHDVLNVDIYPTSENFTASEEFFSHEWELLDSYIARVNQTRSDSDFATLQITLNLLHLVSEEPEPTPETLCMTQELSTGSANFLQSNFVIHLVTICSLKLFLL